MIVNTAIAVGTDCANAATIEITVSDGVPPYQYSIDGGLNFQNNGLFANVTVASCESVVMYANGCQAYDGVIFLEQPLPLTANLNVNGNTVSVIDVEGGNPPYQYNIDTSPYQNSNVFNEVQSGLHCFKVTDLYGCVFENCITLSVLGTANFDGVEFNYYPNPTSGIITLSYPKIISVITVSNVVGQKVLYKKGNSSTMEIDLTTLPSASYFVRVVSEEGEIHTIRVLKQ